MQSNLGDIFWQADWLYRTWAGLRIKNGTKIFELKISVIKPRNDKKKRFREKSTLIVVAGSWTGQSKALTTSLSWREIESPRPGGSLLHFVLEVQPSEGLGESPGPGCKIKFHYTAVLWLQHTQLNIKYKQQQLAPGCQPTIRGPTSIQHHQQEEKINNFISFLILLRRDR